MRKIIFVFIHILFATQFFAQQEVQYTQFFYNKMGINPGYAGSQESPNFTAVIRSQWLGLEGAPQTQLLSFEMPMLYQRVGIGANILRTSMGISEQITLAGTYAYRLRLANGMLGLGLQTSIRYINNNYADPDLTSTVPTALDNAIPNGARSKYVPNFGAGAYFQNQKFYAGISIPRLLTNNIDFNETGELLSEEKLHGYLMTGYIFRVSEKVDFQPQILMKFVANAPFDADLNACFIFADKYTAGLTYRLGGSSPSSSGESIDLMIGAHLSDQLLFGLSYDFTLTEIRDYSNGSIEGVLRYALTKSEGNEIINPRFF